MIVVRVSNQEGKIVLETKGGCFFPSSGVIMIEGLSYQVIESGVEIDPKIQNAPGISAVQIIHVELL